VKMVHNGIEYGDMQLICEAYDLLHRGLGLTADELAEVFTEWNKGELDSFLIEISSHIFAKKDEDGQPLVDKILDTAGQKGTGKWTVIGALDTGQPVTLIGESVFARCLSALKEERVAASKILEGPAVGAVTDHREAFIEDVRRALYCSKIISYAQGYMLLKAAAQENGWNLNMGGIALMWRGGCIIRSRFLGKIKRPSTRITSSQISCSTASFSTCSTSTSPRGARLLCRPSSWAYPPRRFQRLSPSSTATAPTGCPPICCKPSATISARTPTSASTNREAIRPHKLDRHRRPSLLHHLQRITHFLNEKLGLQEYVNPVSLISSMNEMVSRHHCLVYVGAPSRISLRLPRSCAKN